LYQLVLLHIRMAGRYSDIVSCIKLRQKIYIKYHHLVSYHYVTRHHNNDRHAMHNSLTYFKNSGMYIA